MQAMPQSDPLRWLRFVVLVPVLALAVYGGVKIAKTGESERPRERVRVHLELDPLYSARGRAYRTTGVGVARITNVGDRAIDGARLELRMGRTTRFPNEPELLLEPCVVDIARLDSGDTVSVDLLPRFGSRFYSEMSREVAVEWIFSESAQSADVIRGDASIVIYGVSATDWGDSGAVATYVRANDPVVEAFAERALGLVALECGDRLWTEEVERAAAVLSGLASSGIRYRPDPASSLSTMGGRSAIDSIRDPRETLRLKSGDCDDLTVLCCSLLQSIGIRTAIAVFPGHVCMMFDTGLEGGGQPAEKDSFVAYAGRNWIPIETTSLAGSQGSFLKAWFDARPRVRAIRDDWAVIVDVELAWRDHRPGTWDQPEPNPETAFEWDESKARRNVQSSLSSLRTLLRDSLSARIEQITATAEGLEKVLGVGVEYARAGLYSQAEAHLASVSFASPPKLRREVTLSAEDVTDEVAVVLRNLGWVKALGSCTSEDFELSVAYLELSFHGLTDPVDRAEVATDLMLVFRAWGQISMSLEWKSAALALGVDADTIELALESGGPVASGLGRTIKTLRSRFLQSASRYGGMADVLRSRAPERATTSE